MSSDINSNPQNDAWLSIVQKQVASLQFGVVVVTIHNGEVVQIERTEKTRIDQARQKSDTRGSFKTSVKNSGSILTESRKFSE